MKPLRVNIHKLASGYYQTCYISPTTGKKKRNRFHDLKSAKEFQEEIELRYKNKGSQSLAKLPVATLMKLHLKKCPDSKVRLRKVHFRSFMDNFGDFNITDLETPDLREWFYKLKDENDYSEKTLHCIKCNFWHFFRYLEEEQIIMRSPLRKIVFSRDVPFKRPRVFLSVEEVKKVLENAKIYDEHTLYPYLYTMAHTGARRKELLVVPRKDVDFATGLLTLRKTKTGVERSIKMPKSLKAFLQAYLRTHRANKVFCYADGSEIADSGMYFRFRQFKKHFPMDKNWTFHSLRHSLAHNFLDKGGEMYQLQAILGHKNINMTIDTYGQLQAQKITDFSPYEEQEDDNEPKS